MRVPNGSLPEICPAFSNWSMCQQQDWFLAMWPPFGQVCGKMAVCETDPCAHICFSMKNLDAPGRLLLPGCESLGLGLVRRSGQTPKPEGKWRHGILERWNAAVAWQKDVNAPWAKTVATLCIYCVASQDPPKTPPRPPLPPTRLLTPESSGGWSREGWSLVGSS